jgi:hypothetical protein
LYGGLRWLLKVRETALEEKKKCGGCSGELPWLVAVMVDGCSDIEELVVAHGGAVWVNGSAAVEKKKKSDGNVRRNWGCLLG